jgi:hypothetical protein
MYLAVSDPRYVTFRPYPCNGGAASRCSYPAPSRALSLPAAPPALLFLPSPLWNPPLLKRQAQLHNHSHGGDLYQSKKNEKPVKIGSWLSSPASMGSKELDSRSKTTNRRHQIRHRQLFSTNLLDVVYIHIFVINMHMFYGESTYEMVQCLFRHCHKCNVFSLYYFMLHKLLKL